MKDNIKISLPVNRREVDAAQEIISLYVEEDNKNKLEQTINALTTKTEQANRKGLHRDAEILANLVRLAAMHLEDLRDLDKHIK